MTLPTIHLNGTSVEALGEANEQAYQALQLAMSALTQAGPNGRDYYPQAGAMDKAVDEHCDRMRRLKSVLDELGEMGEYLAKEEMKRK